MSVYYLDASAWIKRYYREMGTDWIGVVFAANPPLACASLGLIEILATLARKRKAQELDAEAYSQKVAEVENEWQYPKLCGCVEYFAMYCQFMYFNSPCQRGQGPCGSAA